MKRLRMLKQDRRGIAVAEYGLIFAIAGATIAIGSLAVGSAVSDAIAPQACAPALLGWR